MKDIDNGTLIIAGCCVLIMLAVAIGCAGIKGAVDRSAPDDGPAALADNDLVLLKGGGCRVHLTNGDSIDVLTVRSVTQKDGELNLSCKGTYDTNYRTYIIPISQISYISR